MANCPKFEAKKLNEEFIHPRKDLLYFHPCKSFDVFSPPNDIYLIAQTENWPTREATAIRLKSSNAEQTRHILPPIQSLPAHKHRALVKIPPGKPVLNVLRQPQLGEWEDSETNNAHSFQLNKSKTLLDYDKLKNIPRTVGKIVPNSIIFDRNNAEPLAWRPTNQNGEWVVREDDRSTYVSTTSEEFLDPRIIWRLNDAKNFRNIIKGIPSWARSTGYGSIRCCREFANLTSTPSTFLKHRHRNPLEYIEFTQGNIYSTSTQNHYLHPKNFLNTYRVTSGTSLHQ